MALWVLVYKIGELEFYLTPHGEQSQRINDAVKFTEYEAAINHAENSKKFIKYHPMLTSFEFSE